MERNTEMLEKMFPNIDSVVIGMILESVSNDVEKATDLLLDMSGDGNSSDSMSESNHSQQSTNAIAQNDPVPSWPSLPSSSSGSGNASSICTNSHGSYSSSVSKNPSQSSSSLKAIGSQITVSKNEESKEAQECIKDVANSVKVLVIMRGLPGSGKSTLARK